MSFVLNASENRGYFEEKKKHTFLDRKTLK